MTSDTQPGFFITIDGVDGAGKSTQIERLVAHLQASGRDVLSVRDPGSTDVGTKLRSLLLDSDLTMHRRTEAMLFMASRCEMVETILRPAIASGKVVVSDRYLLSTVVYQSIGSTDSGQPGVPADELWQLGRASCGALDPDLTILLDMPADESLSRLPGKADRMEARGIEYMRAVRSAFLRELANAGGQQVTINASPPADEVWQAIRSAVDTVIQRD